MNGNDKKTMDDKENETDKQYSQGCGYRHQQTYILFLCLTTAYSMRSCMGVALVAMTDGSEDINSTLLGTNRNILSNDGLDATANSTVAEAAKDDGILHLLMLAKPYPRFAWSKNIQDTVQASFFWGYMLLQIPGGMLAHRFGSRYLLLSALLINSATSILLPWAAFYGGWIFLAICRFLQGLSQACIIPAMHTFLGNWAPLQERSRLAGIVYGGQALGAVLGLPITGFIASSSLGWPGIFRFYGVLSGMLGALLWWLLADSPAQHPKISAVERSYIESELGGKKQLRVPWCAILRSPGVWAVVGAHVGQTWGQLTLYTEVPAFMDKVMGVNIKANGILTALPFLAMYFTNFLYSHVCDLLIGKGICSVTNTRKLANSFGSVMAAVGFIILCFVPKNIYIVETVLILICACKMSAHMGFQVINIDMAPNFAGTTMSISNFVANSVSSFSPVVAGALLTDVSSQHCWRLVFLVAAGMYLVSNLIFVVFAIGEKQPWNDPPEEESYAEETKECLPMLIYNDKA